jgi:hypothetical protein
LWRHHQGLDVTVRTTIDERRLARKLADLCQKLTGALNGNGKVIAETVATGDGDLALQNDD